MKALVTGANGFVGSHLCRQLLERGAEVRAFVRPNSDRRLLNGLAIDVVEGNLLDAASLAKATESCEHVYHTAALVRFFIRDKGVMHRTNVDGTRNVLAAARKHGVKRLVHTSTVAVLKSRNGAPCDETCVVDENGVTGIYESSKLEAERLALSAAADGLPVVICNPSGPVGPGDFRPSPVGKVIIHFLKGRILAYTDTGLNLVDVRDVARGHILAAERGRVGERYILSGENLTFIDFLRLLSEISGVPVPKLKLPYGAVLTFGVVGEVFARLTGTEPLACIDSVRTSRKPHYCVADKARRELGYTTEAVRDSLAAEVAWFREEGIA